MATTAEAITERVSIGTGDLTVVFSSTPTSGSPLICASHPTDAMREGSVALLGAASKATVFGINPRGIGGSSAPIAGPQSLEHIVDDLEAARRRLGLGPWVFWGMSGGGWLGEIYAHKYPEGLAGLILESACACLRLRLADPACLLSPFNVAWRDILKGGGLIAPDSHDQLGDGTDTEWNEVPGVGSVFRRRQGPALFVAPFPIAPEMRRAMPVLWNADARAWLPTLRLPTLILCGTADPIVPLPHARAVHEAIAGSEFIAIEGAGHVPVAAGSREVAHAVQRFLRTAS